jgi:hypothetical protein
MLDRQPPARHRHRDEADNSFIYRRWPRRIANDLRPLADERAARAVLYRLAHAGGGAVQRAALALQHAVRGVGARTGGCAIECCGLPSEYPIRGMNARAGGRPVYRRARAGERPCRRMLVLSIRRPIERRAGAFERAGGGVVRRCADPCRRAFDDCALRGEYAIGGVRPRSRCGAIKRRARTGERAIGRVNAGARRSAVNERGGASKLAGRGM